MKFTLSLRKVNTMLSIFICLIAVYIFVSPFLPAITWWVKYDAPIVSAKSENVMNNQDSVPDTNTLVIPKLHMRTEIYEGPTTSTLSKGVWHIPDTSSPDKTGNTIMAGHRFTYAGEAVFYYLDKLAVADTVYVYWEGKRYNYTISAVTVVHPDDTSLVAQTSDPTLTVYTCTPLWSAKDRLVITAKLTEVQ